ncbi:MAG TPA: aldo/keto reductase [Rhodocyclaceae bacterium]|nr:aldo/keto reductase [Rhodocyclaceae bacterium]HRQ46570.1 aldo/keto reductase [Rhodocyclaceae bacterium]
MSKLHSASRRRALAMMGSAAGIAVTGITGLASGAAAAQVGATAPLHKRPIPRSGERLPVVGLGTYRTFDIGPTKAAREPIREVLRRFVDLGGTVIDSSPMYGRAESIVGELATELGVGDRLFHATKVWTRGQASGIAQMEASFERMRVRQMDLMQIHNLLDLETHHATLEAWKAEGRIRYIGITHYQAGAHETLERLIRKREFDFVQVNYSIAEREAEARLLPLAHEHGVAVLVNRPFAQAGLFGRVRGVDLPAWAADFDCRSWGQFFLKYILAHPAVTSVIPATSNPMHLEDNMGAGTGRLPDETTRRKMVEFVANL